MEERVYIVVQLITPKGRVGFNTSISTINYGVYSSQEKANKVIEELNKKDPSAKYMTESWKVE